MGRIGQSGYRPQVNRNEINDLEDRQKVGTSEMLGFRRREEPKFPPVRQEQDSLRQSRPHHRRTNAISDDLKGIGGIGMAPMRQRKEPLPEMRVYQQPGRFGCHVRHVPTTELGSPELRKIVRDHFYDLNTRQNGYNNLGRRGEHPISTVVDVRDPGTGKYGLLVIHEESAAFIGNVFKENMELTRSVAKDIKFGRHFWTDEFRFSVTRNFVHSKSYMNMDGTNQLLVYNEKSSNSPQGSIVSEVLRTSTKVGLLMVSGKDLAQSVGKGLYEHFTQQDVKSGKLVLPD